ncbi:MAG: MBL fold metallo-hydrolase [Deltaproteobacteria bacterium]|nr:MBL fold metallo-hydrolase [Deltaproteobacteria bacterium]
MQSPGAIQVWPLVVSEFALDGGAMFGVIPRKLWSRSYRPDDQGRIRLVSRVLALRFSDQGRTVVIDSGMGRAWTERDVRRYDLNLDVPDLEAALDSIGISARDVTDAVMTHLHFDHAGGWVTHKGDGRPRPVLCNARHHIQREQWDWAANPSQRDKGSFIPGNYSPLEKAGLVDFVDGSKELLPGLSVLALNGHTPGLQIPIIRGAEKTLAFFADLVPTASHANLPWIMAYDLFPLDTLDEKTRILKRAVEENWVVVLEHDVEVEAAVVQKIDDKFKLVPCACPTVI